MECSREFIASYSLSMGPMSARVNKGKQSVKAFHRHIRRRLVRGVILSTAGILLSSYAPLASAETFAEYVQACKSGLGISSIPQFSCKVDNFRLPGGVDGGLDFSETNDFVAHRRINNSVDAVFACRWVGLGAEDRAVSAEMIVHNRHNGATCFFDQPDMNTTNAYPQTDINPVSPTHSAAASVWQIGKTCTRCHAAGPYVASPQIVGALAKYGLINDGHDVWNGFYHPVGSSTTLPVVHQPDCASACHTMGGSPPTPSVTNAGFIDGKVVMPSINHVINEVINQNHMPPNDPYSDYRWVNRDSQAGSGDWEDLTAIQREFPQIACSDPVAVEAHVVDSGEVITTDRPDVFNRFNLQDGLVCLHSDQPSGSTCHNYQTRYMCNGRFTAFQDLDSPSSSGDWESRGSFKNLCSNPTWIQARYDDGSRWVYLNGPADRLSRFNSSGLVCLNSEQNNGQCSNYVVRFICP